MSICSRQYMRSVPKVSGLSSYLRTRTFEGPIPGMTVDSILTKYLDATVTDRASWFASSAFLFTYNFFKCWRRICINFWINFGKSSPESIKMMQKAFVYECVGKAQIKDRYELFQDGRTSGRNSRNNYLVGKAT